MRPAVALGLTLGWLIALGASATAQSVQLVPFGGQDYDTPFHVTGVPGDPDRVFVVEAAGTIRLVKSGVTQSTPFLDISADVWDINEGGCECGLFSMAPAPDYASSGRFYVFYTRDIDPGIHYLRIEEFRRSASNPDLADPSSRRIVLEIPHLDASNHNGGQLQFGPDGLLYIWVGDGGLSGNAQPLDRLAGKILRIDPVGAAPFQYSIPADNPYADGPGGNGDEIYASGVRNPWRGSFDRATGDLTFGDVGAGSWEEIDFKLEGTGIGANFGWDCFEGMAVGSGCPVQFHSPPVHQYSNGGSGAAVTGGFVVRDSALPSLAGRYIYTDSQTALGGELRTVVLAPGGASGDAPLGINVGGVVSFGQDACGHIYAAAISGPVGRLEPTSGPFPCKTAPELELVDVSGARRAARKRALAIRASCDEDCTASATGTIVVKGSSGASRSRKIRGAPGKADLELGQPGIVRVLLSKKQAKRLRVAFREGRRAVALIGVSVSGGGGGTTSVTRRVKQKR
jgi:glucose/arabinose dehydrogenase